VRWTGNPIGTEVSAGLAHCWSQVRWLKSDFVVDCISKALFAAEIAFRGLNADVAEQERSSTGNPSPNSEEPNRRQWLVQPHQPLVERRARSDYKTCATPRTSSSN
jgi:hypothetical protein